MIDDADYAAAFGLDLLGRAPGDEPGGAPGDATGEVPDDEPGDDPADAPLSARALWTHLLDQVGDALPARHRRAVENILEHGTLARRLVAALGPAPGREALRAVYAELAGCLRDNRLFEPQPTER